MLLWPGSSNGVIKKYQIFMQKNHSNDNEQLKLQHWPRMNNQRISCKNSARTLTSQHVGHVSSCIASINDDMLISVGCDGRIITHSVITGKLLHSMEGFATNADSSYSIQNNIDDDDKNKISSLLCSSRDGMLITNGMLDYVCVHDFNIKEWEENSDDFSDWLDFGHDD